MHSSRIVCILKRGLTIPVIRYNSAFFLSTIPANLANYFLTTTAARRFAPGDYSQLGVVLNLTVAFYPVSSAVGGAMIRSASFNRAAGNVARTDAIQRALNRYLLVLHMGLLAAVVVAHGQIGRFFHLTIIAPLYLVMAMSFFAFMFGLLQGILQESGKYTRLSTILLGETIVRSALGILAIVLGFGVTGVVFVYAASAALVVLVLPRPPAFWTGERAGWQIVRPLFRDIGQLAFSSFCLAVLVNLDVVLCRRYLSPVIADRYVALAAVAKVFMYSTGSLSTVAFAEAIKAAHRGESNNRLLALSFGILGGLGLLFVALGAVLGPFVMELAFGSAFRSGGQLLWVSAISAVAISAINLAVAYFNARNWLWYLAVLLLGSAATIAALALAHDSLRKYAAIFATGTSVLALALMIPLVLLMRKDMTRSARTLRDGEPQDQLGYPDVEPASVANE